MNFIQGNQIDFNSLSRFNCGYNTEAILYRDDNNFYKFYRNIHSEKVKRKFFKLLILNDGVPLKNVIVPDTLIVNKELLLGCRMDYIEYSLPLFRFTSVSDSVNKFLNMIYDVSFTLREIHVDSRNIVVGDLNFNNIIFDSDFNHYFVDFDGSMVDGIGADRIPSMFHLYLKNHGIYKYDINRDTDKLCMMLNTLYMIFSKRIDLVTMDEYDEKAERLETLRNMREFVLKIKRCNNRIPVVPYLDELISSNDFATRNKIKKVNVKVKNIR